MTMADRIVIMKDGKIQQVGSPQEVCDDPAMSLSVVLSEHRR